MNKKGIRATSQSRSDFWIWILDHLRNEALGGHGWRRRGTRGWRLREELDVALAIRTSEILSRLDRAGWVDRTRVEDPARRSPLHLYRISARGMSRLYREEGKEHVPELIEPVSEDEDPEAGTIFVPRYEWIILTALRRQALEEIGPARWGEHGWLTGLEIARLTNRASGELLHWLLSRGLVQRREAPAQGRGGRPVRMYRASRTGLHAQMLDAVPVLYEPPARMQVRIRPAGLR